MHCHALYLESSWKRKCPQESGLFCCNFPSRPGPVNANARSADVWLATWELGRGGLGDPLLARGSRQLTSVQGSQRCRGQSCLGFPPFEGPLSARGTGGVPQPRAQCPFRRDSAPRPGRHRQCAPLPGAAQRPQTHCPLPASSQGGC